MNRYTFDAKTCPLHPESNLTVDLGWFGLRRRWGLYALCEECGTETSGVEVKLASNGKEITDPDPNAPIHVPFKAHPDSSKEPQQ